MSKKINIHYTMKSTPDVAAVTINNAAGHISISELKKLVDGGVSETIDPYAPISVSPSRDNGLEPDDNNICVTFNVSGSLKVHMTRAETETFLQDIEDALKKPCINDLEAI